MATVIGKCYEDTKRMLRKRISASDTDALFMDSVNDHTCYFCLRPISGKARMLEDPVMENSMGADFRFFIDDLCYMAVRSFAYRDEMSAGPN